MLAFTVDDAERDGKNQDDKQKRVDKRERFIKNCEEEYKLQFEQQDCSVSVWVVGGCGSVGMAGCVCGCV